MFFGDYLNGEFFIFYDDFEGNGNGLGRGVFMFFIEDEVYPLRGSDYNISVAVNNLISINKKIVDCKVENFDADLSDCDLIRDLIESHGLITHDKDVRGVVNSGYINPMGIVLSTEEMLKVGCYVFYFLINEDEECLIYSRSYGKEAKRSVFKNGEVSDVLNRLSEIENV